MVLILEDNKERMKTFRLYCHNHTHVEKAIDCINIIKSGKQIDELWLDHDLGNETYVDSGREDCGMEVVRFLKENDYKESIKRIFVHSHNVYANHIMTADLVTAGYNAVLFPFGKLYTQVRST